MNEVTYFCDPAANTECDHKHCAMFCGGCYSTGKREFALPGPDGLPEVVTPRKAAEMRALHGIATLERYSPGTTDMRLHNHDTLWAVLAGIGAAAAFAIVMMIVILGALSYARGI